ncbi:MAG: SRPBCC family protein [Acidimicrobiales bacterium]
MTHYVVRAGRIVEAPLDTVWDMIADARSYSSWAVMGSSTLEREGSPTPDGVGAIRNFGTGTIMSREEVVAFDPPTHLGYRLLSGLPIENYRADVTLTSLGDRRTRVMWVGTYESKGFVGAVMRRFLTFVLGDFVRRLAKHAPKRG